MTPEFINQFDEDKRVWALSAYVNASRILIRAKSIEELIDGVCQGVTNQPPYVLACVGLNRSGPDKAIDIVGWAGKAKGYAEDLALSWDENNPLGQGPTGIAIRSRKSILCEDTESAPNFGSWVKRARDNGIRSSISVPLFENDNPIGIFIVYASQPSAFGTAETKLFEMLADELSYGISNLNKHKKLEEETIKKDKLQKELLATFELTISAIATTLEFRDPYTAGHQRRVSDIAVAIAEELGLKTETVESIKLAAFVHDIGKVSVPIEYLTKPTKLTTLEKNIIKEHVEKGYEILKDIPFPLPIAQIVRQHHERMDGSGYPQGLKGEQILMEARILAVADVIESMATNRPYRFSVGLGKAVSEIVDNAGIVYDSIVAKATQSLYESGKLETLIRTNNSINLEKPPLMSDYP